jgi:putative membrane fusion protein
MRAKKSKMSSVYIFPVLFFIICSSYLIRFMFFNIETDIVKYDSIENSIQTKALIVRNETTTTLPAGVDINYKVNEGEKISFGKKILEIIKNNQADENIAIKIKQLDDRINEIKQADINNNFFSQDKEKIESQINEKVAELKNLSKSGDFEKLGVVKNDLTANLYKKSLIYGNGSFFGKNVEQLQKEKSTLEGIYKNNIDVIYAQAAGVVCYSLDGYEQILSPANIKDFKLSNIKEIMNSMNSKKSSADKGSAVGVKVVDNFEWYTCSMVGTDIAKDFKTGKRIKLRFAEFENVEVNGEVYEISQPEGDTCLLIIKISEHVNDFYKKRIVDMDIIKAYNEGFTVPSKAIVVKDNIKGVYVLRSGMVKFVPVAVMTEGDDQCLVRNLGKEDSSYKAGYEPLKIFDEIITTTKRVKENQVLTDKI